MPISTWKNESELVHAIADGYRVYQREDRPNNDGTWLIVTTGWWMS